MLASWLAVIGLGLTASSLWLATKQLRDGYEHRFVERFWLLEDRRLDTKYKRSPADSAEGERYLRLCEDEFEAMGLGGISFRTWNVWHVAVRSALRPGTATRALLDGLAPDEYELLRDCVNAPAHRSGRCPALSPRQRLLGRAISTVARQDRQ